MFKGYKLSEAAIKQLYGLAIALASWAITKYAAPGLADALMQYAPMVLGIVFSIVFGVDVVGLARQNADKELP